MARTTSQAMIRYRQQRDTRRKRIIPLLIKLAGLLAMIQAEIVTIHHYIHYLKRPYHNRVGEGAELMRWAITHVSPKPLLDEWGVEPRTFKTILHEPVQVTGLEDSRYIGIEEKLGIFLYICRMGLSVRKTGGRFQRSYDTVAK